jgi:hypothetical protein
MKLCYVCVCVRVRVRVRVCVRARARGCVCVCSRFRVGLQNICAYTDRVETRCVLKHVNTV